MSPETFSSFVPNGLYDGSDEQERVQLEAVVSEHYREPAIDICNTLRKLWDGLRLSVLINADSTVSTTTSRVPNLTQLQVRQLAVSGRQKS